MRKRMTWADARRASAPPATPGYLEKDEHSHPADQADPDGAKYQNGDPAEWAEDPRKGPYTQSAAPSLPSEDGGHPASKKAALQHRLERKAAKCIRIAQLTFGKHLPAAKIERLAFAMMDQPDAQIDANLTRLGGGFLADEFDGLDDFSDPVLDDGIDDLLVDDEFDDIDALPLDDGLDELSLLADEAEPKADDVKAEIQALKAEIQALKAGRGQASEVDADEAMLAEMLAEDVAAEDPVADDAAADEAMLAEMLADDLSAEDEADEDVASLYAFAKRQAAKKSEDEESDDVEAAKKAYDKAKAAKKSDEAKESEDETKAAKKAYVRALNKAAKAAEEDSEDQAAAEEEVKAAKKAYDKVLGKTAKKSEEAKESEDDSEEESEEDDAPAAKEAKKKADASMFSRSDDPMGLSDRSITAEADPLLEQLFGRTAEDESEADDEGQEASDAEAEAEEEKLASLSFFADDAEADDAEAEEEAPKAAKTASRRSVPAATPARKGVRSLGAVSRTASASSSELVELEKLWAHSPDVSDRF